MAYGLQEALCPDKALVVGDGGGVLLASRAPLGLAGGLVEHETAPLHILMRVRGLEHQLPRRARYRTHRVQNGRVDAENRELRACASTIAALLRTKSDSLFDSWHIAKLIYG